jgi:Excalibur calcium-binding domain
MSNTPTNNNEATTNQIIDLIAKYYNVFLSVGLLTLAYYLKWNAIVLILFVLSLSLFIPAVKKVVDSTVSDGVKKVIATFMAGVSAIAGFFGLNNQEPVKPVNNNANNSSVVVSSTSKSSLVNNKISSSTANNSTNSVAKIESSKTVDSKGNIFNQIFGGDKKTSSVSSISTQNQANKSQDNQPRPKGFVEGNCSDLKAKGIVNIKKGDVNYTEERDRNNDGVACEE